MSQPRAPSVGTSPKHDDPVSGIMTFIVADLIVFALLFCGFMVDRSKALDVFNSSSAQLDLSLGIANLLILVTSGLCVVYAVSAAREGDARRTRFWLVAGLVIGLGFAVSKVIEWSAKIGDGITMHTNEFFMFYFALTGAHFLHFLGGMIALIAIFVLSFRNRVDGDFYGKIEAVGLYWHMVDLLWILIFPLLYILGLEWRSC